MQPELIIADEPVSALDISIQAQIINLLSSLQKSLGLTLLFSSHDLRVVRYITRCVAVMYLGGIAELGATEEVFQQPRLPYTSILIKAAPILDLTNRVRDYAISGEPPSPINVPPDAISIRGVSTARSPSGAHSEEGSHQNRSGFPTSFANSVHLSFSYHWHCLKIIEITEKVLLNIDVNYLYIKSREKSEKSHCQLSTVDTYWVGCSSSADLCFVALVDVRRILNSN